MLLDGHINAIGQYFINLARQDIKKHLINLPDKDQVYFTEGAEHFEDYVEALHWALDYVRWPTAAK
ncbi:MAG: RtcB family protein [Methylococcales bacterium]